MVRQVLKYAGMCIISLGMCRFAQAQDTYRLSVDLETGKIQVVAQIEEIAQHETLCLPAFGQRFGEHFFQPSITQTRGEPQAIALDSAGCISAAGAGMALEVRYTLQMDALADDHVWLASELSALNARPMLAFPGESLFVERGANDTPSGARETRVTVEHGGQIVSTMGTVPLDEAFNDPNDVQGFIAKDRFELSRSFWTFGTSRILVASSEHINLQIAYDASWPIAVIQREIGVILDEYARTIPDKTPKNLSVFCFDVPFDSHYHHGFARPGGIILQMGKTALSQASTRRILLAHELFHIYNGEGLRFAPKEYEQTAWFREGVTQYIALQTLISLGLINQAQFNEWMASSIERARNDKNPSLDAYHAGFFISLAFDQQWRIYQTPYSMVGFWRWLGSAPQWYLLHTNATLRAALSAYSSFDFSTFFAQYLKDKKPLPIDSILRLSGLCLRHKKTWFYSTGIDYGFDSQNARLYVKKLAPNGVGRQAGLAIGDVIAAAPDTNWNDSSNKQITVIKPNAKKNIRIPPASVSKDGISVEPCSPP